MAQDGTHMSSEVVAELRGPDGELKGSTQDEKENPR